MLAVFVGLALALGAGMLSADTKALPDWAQVFLRQQTATTDVATAPVARANDRGALKP